MRKVKSVPFWLVLYIPAFLLSLYMGIALANHHHYNLNDCHFNPSNIYPITYRYYNVLSRFRTAFYEGQRAWDNTSAPGYFGYYPTEWNPQIKVKNRRFNGDPVARATANGGCDYQNNNHFWYNNSTDIVFNSDLHNQRTSVQWMITAMHEIGHVYGLDHVSTNLACVVMNSPSRECPTSLPADGDILGIVSIYSNSWYG